MQTANSNAATTQTAMTPGPWQIGSPLRHPDSIGICRAWHDGTEPMEETIAEVMPSTPADTAQADARAIAAVPELIEVLQTLAEYWWQGTPVYPGSIVTQDAEAALRKALGTDEKGEKR